MIIQIPQLLKSIQESSNFMCYINNTVGSIHKRFHVIVQYAPIFDGDKSLEQKLSVKFHHGVNLECKVDGSPDPTVKWIFVSF
jgi:hypothetical protein